MTIPLLFPSITIVGAGLIGSSLARAARKNNLCTNIKIYDSNKNVCARVQDLNIADQIHQNLKSAIEESSFLILATPPGTIDSLCIEIGKYAKKDTIIMDVASTKASVIKAAASLPHHLYFVPTHPVAGTEQSGPEAGFAQLFEQRWSIITPLAREDEAYQGAVKRVEEFWRGVGAQTDIMDAAHHDLALAITSHLPHLIAFTLVGAADDLESVSQGEIVKYSAGGFRDFTRIAASDPTMWRDVFLNNKDAILEVLGRFSEELALLQRAIRWDDGETLTNSFTRGRLLRRAIVDAGQETEAPDFGRTR